MALIDPLQYMTLMGKAPERSKINRPGPVQKTDNFAQQMQSALTRTNGIVIPEVDGTGMENSLIHDALHRLTSLTGPLPGTPKTAAKNQTQTQALGNISAQFESGTQGSSAIGYDRTGGTSYGIYQIASKPGTMSQFIDYLGQHEPDWAAQLKAAGPANTGSRSGRMPLVWADLAQENPQRFAQIQHDFIAATHYQPARDKILSRTGVDLDSMPQAVREALWSTSVQHGPAGAAKIFSRLIGAVEKTNSDRKFAQNLINKLYEDRKGHFGSSTARVQASARQRMDTEKNMVLAMLQDSSQQNA